MYKYDVDLQTQVAYLTKYDPDNKEKWDSWLCHADWGWLIINQKLFQAKLVKYYMKLSTAEPAEKIKVYYNKVMKDINELVGLISQ